MPAATPATQPGLPQLPLRSAWLMLLTLISGFALSQAYRTLAGILSVPLTEHFQLSPQTMGLIAATFHYAFGGMQLLMGIGIDLFGIRRTILLAFPLTIAGATLSALASSAAQLVLGQALIGVGCAPAFLVCTVFIARYFPAHRFAAISGLALGVGSLGMIFTGTPLAWLVERFGWQTGFGLLAGLSLLAWLLIYWRVFEPSAPASDPASANAHQSATSAPAQRESPWQALKGYGMLLRMPHTAGILSLVFVGYAAFIALRGLWLAPYLDQRFGQDLIFSGNIALALSVISLFSPSLFGRLDPGSNQRRRWLLMRLPWLIVALFLLLAATQQLWLAVAAILSIAVLGGYGVWQYADVRAAYPSHMTGRAMALFTMSMFLGVAVMQTLTGAAAGWALAHGREPFFTVFVCIALVMALGVSAYTLLPKPAAQTQG
ncbi:MFS transporter [Vandammella animalimorsus]|uniref:MFS transporter n=1 Tax=Vandammella animalimorsus TaxID=2029117 RepID=A0A2A2T862_9BURK|nr:MFS transporter [Vandammella animalimorsus]PAT30990.1 MFS transporter [Vandammella animalimorsus]PAX18284.1 MFS transporter [Vandammella animalimorsus]PAX20447.1 MFS transporter [Vandammella animalimorsus]